MHICVGNLTIIGSDNGLSHGRRQSIIWTNAGILLNGTLGNNFSEILSEIHTFSFKKMHLKRSSGKWRPSCLGLNVLKSRGDCVLQEKMFYVWFNTFFIRDTEENGEAATVTDNVCVMCRHPLSDQGLATGCELCGSVCPQPNTRYRTLTLTKSELDNAHKDKAHKLFSDDFKVRQYQANKGILD